MNRLLLRNFIIFTTLTVLLFASLLSALIQKSAKVTEERTWITHTYAVLDLTEELRALTESMINSQRAYIITGDAPFMAEYESYKSELSGALAKFAELTNDNPSQQSRLSEIRGYFTGLTFNLEERARIYVKQKGKGFTEGVATVDGLRKNIMRVHDDMVAEEKAILSQRLTKADELRAQYRSILYIGGSSCVVLLLMLNLFLLLSQMRQIKTEKSLQESEDRFALATEGANDGIFDWNLDAGRIYCSQAFFSMLGNERPSEVISINEMKSMIHPEDRENMSSSLEKYLRGERAAYSVQYRMRHVSGKWIWVASRAKAIYDDTGKAIRLVGANIDITSLKAQHERLENARLEAEKASRSKSDFLAHMSHEIRTPLTAICGVSEILEKQMETLNDRQKKLINSLSTSSRALKDLVNDILDYSKIEHGEITLEIKEFEISETFEQARAIVSDNAVPKGIDLIFDYEAVKHARIKGDSGRIRQILLNIIGNATKFTDAGYVKVTAELVDDREIMTRYLRVDVADTGIGIDEAALGTIFERFKQEDSTITRKFGGTGLGLPISRDLARLMGGDVTVTSRKGVGSIFTITIPIGSLDEVLPITQLPDLDHSAFKLDTTAAQDARERVLIVDDVEGNVLVVGNLLEDMGIPYDVAVNGKKALEAVGKSRYGLILMDVQMPEMDGITATKTIRAEEMAKELNPVPIIGMTAHALVEDKKRCLDAGMNGYLTKPIDTAEYSKIIERFLPDRQQKTAAA